MNNKVAEYSLAIASVILSLFKNEEGGNENFHFDINEVDATLFITSMAIGCNVVLEKLTGEDKTHLEFTHLLNSLIVQSMMEEKENDNGCKSKL